MFHCIFLSIVDNLEDCVCHHPLQKYNGILVQFGIDIVCLELGLGSCRVGFVFGLNLNGLKTPEPELDLFNKWVEKPQPKPLKT